MQASREVAKDISVLRFEDNDDGWHAELELPQYTDPLAVNEVYQKLIPKTLGRPGGFIRRVVTLSDTKIRVSFSGVSPRMVKSLFREILAHLDLAPLAQT